MQLPARIGKYELQEFLGVPVLAAIPRRDGH